eukprot:TRINITY_DN14332_c0_g2_i1.p1 TRINITY_DN14332_c0_g2~~TRINITY_DN14332_c0_g2_i1.p1  ORF type:complete len:200 (-),score=47.60 TRINITY_DN14332_c0_g2_i1:510-1109(-)
MVCCCGGRKVQRLRSSEKPRCWFLNVKVLKVAAPEGSRNDASFLTAPAETAIYTESEAEAPASGANKKAIALAARTAAGERIAARAPDQLTKWLDVRGIAAEVSTVFQKGKFVVLKIAVISRDFSADDVALLTGLDHGNDVVAERLRACSRDMETALVDQGVAVKIVQKTDAEQTSHFMKVFSKAFPEQPLPDAKELGF